MLQHVPPITERQLCALLLRDLRCAGIEGNLRRSADVRARLVQVAFCLVPERDLLLGGAERGEREQEGCEEAHDGRCVSGVDEGVKGKRKLMRD